jgi:hypothetical protein
MPTSRSDDAARQETRVAIGRNRCHRCRAVSPLYALFPTCRYCCEETCVACGESYDDETNRITCRECQDG